MFSKVFVEKRTLNNPYTVNILNKFKSSEVLEIDKIDDIFEKVKKPYLQKRETLNLFLGEKPGKLVKLAPDAYGLSGDPHYYYVHAYNCIYECEYCYLQGYFKSPDIVLFTNHHEILAQMQDVLKQNSSKNCWFHAGEYSDSLALSHITGELPLYYDFAQKNPSAIIELRTKSANTKIIEDFSPLENFITSFSLSPKKEVRSFDLKTAPLETRLKAIERLDKRGHPIALHFDPIIFSENTLESYESLFDQVFSSICPQNIKYISLGVVRFTPKVFHEVKKNYPQSKLLEQDFSKSFDNKIRYPRPLRMNVLQKLKQELIDRGCSKDSIYLCME